MANDETGSNTEESSQDTNQPMLEDNIPCKANERCCPKDGFGNEYMIENNGEYIYPKTTKGKPRYRIENGSQIYETVRGKQLIGTGDDKKQYYAIDRFGNEYYPDDNTPAKLADGTIYYASAADGKQIFPIDSHGNECYLTFIDFAKPTTIPNRYARSFSCDEIYPLIVTPDKNEKQYLINNKYAVDKNKKPYYPKDGFKNEYYRKASSLDIVEFRNKYSISQILLERYAMTNDGKIILPTVLNRFYRSPHIEPLVMRENVIGRLIRDEDNVSDYITNVSYPTFKAVYFKQYKYKKLISNETVLVTPKQPSPAINFVVTTCIPFYRRWYFWAFFIISLIIKSFVVWWFYFKKPIPNMSS